ncbi:MAG: isomerizing glutamine--fructose-6-phosphate transaminase, partial [Chloroflexota bacterium]|nr:isomerizing glutamine--fructose-6-phosphate transaminase [Chloroflexota bacterium]
MCGIVGYFGQREAWPIILNGLSQLEYRGYDSAGIAVLDPYGRFSIKKTVGRVQSLISDDTTVYPQGTIALGHTRWATHGPPSYDNAHPHVDCSQRVAVVHNGIIENFLDLKNKLEAEGHIFASQTDSEVIPHLIEVGLSKGNDFEEAFRYMARQLKGSQAIVALSQSPERVLCGIRLGYAGGLVIANYKGETILGSALPAMLPLFEQDMSSSHDVVFLESEEMVTVTRSNTTYQDLDGHVLRKEPVSVAVSDLSSDKGNYSHFMLKEIMEQPDVVGATFKERVDFYNNTISLPDFQISDADVLNLTRVILVGCGTSLHAAQVGRNWIEEFGGIPASAESASEFRYNHLTVDSKTLVITIGQSGETADTIAAMDHALSKG